MKRKTIIILSVIALIIATLAYFVLVDFEDIPAPPKDSPIVAADGVVPYLDTLAQNLDTATHQREHLWFMSQGSEILPYSWFTWLEQAENNTLFRNVEHMAALGFLPQKSSKYNPSGLPIGFSISSTKKYADAAVGLTCSACHTGQINYGGKRYIVEGAPSLANFIGFFEELLDALEATQKDESKFNRFAKKVIGEPTYSKEAAKDKAKADCQKALAKCQEGNKGKPKKEQVKCTKCKEKGSKVILDLRRNLGLVTSKLSLRQKVNDLPCDYPEDFTAHGRIDAFGNIQNAIAAIALKDPTNNVVPNAPVSLPFLWGTHQADFVQWIGSASNEPRTVGPLIRNVAEAVGVFGQLEIRKADWKERLFGNKFMYKSTVDYYGIGMLEGYIKRLRSPRWLASFPTIDAELAEKGKKLYVTHCGDMNTPNKAINATNCHQIIPYELEDSTYKVTRTDLTHLKTDRIVAKNGRDRKVKTLMLEGAKMGVVIGDKRYGLETRASDIVVNGVAGLLLKRPYRIVRADKGTSLASTGNEPLSIRQKMKNIKGEAKVQLEQFGVLAAKGSTGGVVDTNLYYRARPLNGVWATAPFLHNGSVPNLWELLKKPADRVTSFWVGDVVFDPKNVGLSLGEQPNSSEFRVLKPDGGIMPGNSNRGHDYGTNLTDEEKWALIEFMKTL